MFVVWGALVLVGCTVKGMIWLIPLGIGPFVITGAYGAMGTAHPAPLTHPVERAGHRRGHRVRHRACRQSPHSAFRKRRETHRCRPLSPDHSASSRRRDRRASVSLTES